MALERYVPEKPHISDGARIGSGVVIGKRAIISYGVSIGRNSVIREGVQLNNGVTIGENVTVGPRVKIGRGSLIKSDAKICPNDVRSVSTHGRILRQNVIVGPGVLLHDDIELGDDAIVPSQETVMSLGVFGRKNRVITTYGSDEGPMFSVGCMLGVDFDTFYAHVNGSIRTTQEGASKYKPFMDFFEFSGQVVQRMYEAETAAIDQLRAEHASMPIHTS